MSGLSRYRKFVIALLGALVTVGATLPADAPSWAPRTAALASALLVLIVPNAPQPDLSRLEKVVPSKPTTYSPRPPRPPSTPLGRTRHPDDPAE